MTSSSEGDVLRSRWGRDRCEAVLEALRAGRDLASEGVGRTEAGLWDLRGIWLPGFGVVPAGRVGGYETERYVGMLKFVDVEVVGVDFSFAVLPHLRFTDVTIRGCVFDSADVSGWRMWTTAVSDCSFVGTTVGSFQVGAWTPEKRRGNSMTRCVFDGVDLTALNSDSGWFEQCRFLNVKLQSTFFIMTVFRDCEFSGRFSEVQWDGRDRILAKYPGLDGPNRMTGCRFSADSVMFGCSFRGIDTRAVVLPADELLALVDDFQPVMAKAAAYIEGLPPEKLAIFARLAKMFHRLETQEELAPTDQNVLDLKIYTKDGPEWHDMIRAALRAGGWDGRTGASAQAAA